MGREHEPPAVVLLSALHAVDQDPDRIAGHVRQRLADRGEAEGAPARHGDVVEAGDRDRAGDVDAEVAGGVQRAERDDVVRAKDRRRAVTPIQEVAGPLVAAAMGELAHAPQRRVERRPALRQGSAEAGLAIAAGRGVRRPGDERDASMAEAMEVLGDLRGAPRVVGHDAVDLGTVDVSVEQHAGHRALGDQGGDARLDGDRDEERAVGAASAIELGQPGLTARVGALVDEDHAIPGAPERLVQRLDELGIERILDVGDDDGDRPRAPRDQAARRRVGHVAAAVGHPDDARGRLRVDPRISAQSARDRRLRDAGLLGDVVARDAQRLRAQGASGGVRGATAFLA